MEAVADGGGGEHVVNGGDRAVGGHGDGAVGWVAGASPRRAGRLGAGAVET
jgi:hypothetical protein